MFLRNAIAGQYSVFTAFIEQGDEVIMFEPFFDQYLPSVVFQGGKPVYVPLHPLTDKEKPTSNDWIIDFDELRCVITLKTWRLTAHLTAGEL